jgi:hypothetical protein
VIRVNNSNSHSAILTWPIGPSPRPDHWRVEWPGGSLIVPVYSVANRVSGVVAIQVQPLETGVPIDVTVTPVDSQGVAGQPTTISVCPTGAYEAYLESLLVNGGYSFDGAYDAPMMSVQTDMLDVQRLHCGEPGKVPPGRFDGSGGFNNNQYHWHIMCDGFDPKAGPGNGTVTARAQMPMWLPGNAPDCASPNARRLAWNMDMACDGRSTWYMELTPKLYAAGFNLNSILDNLNRPLDATLPEIRVSYGRQVGGKGAGDMGMSVKIFVPGKPTIHATCSFWNALPTAVDRLPNVRRPFELRLCTTCIELWGDLDYSGTLTQLPLQVYDPIAKIQTPLEQVLTDLTPFENILLEVYHSLGTYNMGKSNEGWGGTVGFLRGYMADGVTQINRHPYAIAHLGPFLHNAPAPNGVQRLTNKPGAGTAPLIGSGMSGTPMAEIWKWACPDVGYKRDSSGNVLVTTGDGMNTALVSGVFSPVVAFEVWEGGALKISVPVPSLLRASANLGVLPAGAEVRARSARGTSGRVVIA